MPLTLMPNEEEEDKPTGRLTLMKPEQSSSRLTLMPREQSGSRLTLMPDSAPVDNNDDYWQHAVASVMDIPAGLVALPGLIQAGGTAVKRLAMGESVKGSMDNTLLRTANKMTEGVNGIMGIEQPEEWEQLARLASLALPTPDKFSKIGSLIAKPGIVQKVGDVAGMITMPFAQYTPGASLGVKAAQIGLQGAVGVGADQGIRALTDQPLMMKTFEDDDANWLYENPIKAAVGTTAVAALGFLARNAYTQNLANIAAMEKSKSDFNSVPANLMPEAQPSGSIGFGARMFNSGVDAQQIVHDQVLLATGDVNAANKVIRGIKVNPNAAAQFFTPTGIFPDSAIRVNKGDTVKDIILDTKSFTPEDMQVFNHGILASNEVHNRITATMHQLNPAIVNDGGKVPYVRNQIQKLDAYAAKLKNDIDEAEGVIHDDLTPPQTAKKQRDFIEETRKRLKNIEYSVSNWAVMSHDLQSMKTITGKDGKVWQIADDIDSGVESVFSKNASLSEQLDFMRSLGIDSVRTGLRVGDNEIPHLNASTPGGQSVLAADHQLFDAIKKMKANPRVMAVVEKYGRLTDKMLDYMVEKRRLSPELRALWRRNHTLDGITLYGPGMESVQPAFGLITRLKYILGWNTPEANEAIRPLLRQMANKGIVARAKTQLKVAGQMLAKERSDKAQGSLIGPLNREAIDEGTGINNPVNPLPALESYISHVFEHTIQNSSRSFALSKIASTVTRATIENDAIDDALIVARYDTVNPVNGTTLSDPEIGIQQAMRKRSGIDNIKELEKDLVSVYEDGIQVRYYVPNATLRHGLEYHTNLVEGIHRIGAVMKNIYTMGTTRNIFFAPVQAAFSTFMHMLTSPARGIIYTPLDAAKGITHRLIAGFVNETADHLDIWLKDAPGLFKHVPFVESLKNSLRDIVEKSMMMEIGATTGASTSGGRAVESITKLAKTTNDWAGALDAHGHGATWGIMKGIWRYGAIMNAALQDGPLIGLQLKAMRQELNKSYGVVARPKEIDGVKIIYKSPPAKENGKIPPAQYDRATNTIHIDVDRLKKAHKSGWKSDKPQYANMEKHFDNADDFAEYVLQHELAHARQAKNVDAPDGLARELEANDLATMARRSNRADAAGKANVIGKQGGGDYLAMGSSDFVRNFRTWVPFAGAAIHGMRALGKAFKDAPVKTSVAMATVVGVPAAAELIGLYNLASDEQKEAYWKVSSSQRVSNIHMPNPDGKTFTLIPVEPLLRVPRAIMIESLDAMTNWSNKYRAYRTPYVDEDVESGRFMHAFITSLQSVINLPMPPIFGAGLALAGYTWPLGVDPNAQSGLGAPRPLAGQQITAMGRDQTTMPDGLLDNSVEAAFNAIGGMTGSLMVSVFNQLTLGSESSIPERVGRAFEDTTKRLGMYSRVGTLFGLEDTAKLSRASYLDKELRPMEDGMKAMTLMVDAHVKGDMLPGGVMPAGNIQIAPDNPEQLEAIRAGALLMKDPRFKRASETISTAFKQISVIKSRDRIQPENKLMLPWLHEKAGQPWTREDKMRAENDLTRIIQQERTVKLYMMKEMQEAFGFKFADYAGKSPPIRFDSPFDGYHEPLASDETPEGYMPTPEAQSSQ